MIDAKPRRVIASLPPDSRLVKARIIGSSGDIAPSSMPSTRPVQSAICSECDAAKVFGPISAANSNTTVIVNDTHTTDDAPQRSDAAAPA